MLTRKNPISCEVNGDNCSEPEVKQRVRFLFKREEHLKGRKEIREVFNKGKRVSVNGAKLFLRKNDLPYNRICFSFSRGFGNAVVRNRIRRLEREAFRLLKTRLTGGYDLILLAFHDAGGKENPNPLKKAVLHDKSVQLETLFKKAGLLK